MIQPGTPLPWERLMVQDGEITGPGDSPEGYAGDWYESNELVHVYPDDGEQKAVGYLLGGKDAAYVKAACNLFPELVAALKRLIERDLTDVKPCRYDRNGYCQEHYSDRPCAVQQARAVLKQIPEG